MKRLCKIIPTSPLCRKIRLFLYFRKVNRINYGRRENCSSLGHLCNNLVSILKLKLTTFMSSSICNWAFSLKSTRLPFETLKKEHWSVLDNIQQKNHVFPSQGKENIGIRTNNTMHIPRRPQKYVFAALF